MELRVPGNSADRRGGVGLPRKVLDGTASWVVILMFWTIGKTIALRPSRPI